jgi:bacterioferritin-associated ferredoxin
MLTKKETRMYVCLCKGLTESDVLSVAHSGKYGPEALKAALGLDDEDCCGRCARNIQELVTIATGRMICSVQK